jgi:CheY-like chemotaxis protein
MKKQKKKIIFIEDNPEGSKDVLEFLKKHDLNVTRIFRYGAEAAEYIRQQGDYDIAIVDRRLGTDHNLAQIMGYEIMELSKKINPKKLVISYSEYYDKPPYADYVLMKNPFPHQLEALVKFINERVE